MTKLPAVIILVAFLWATQAAAEPAVQVGQRVSNFTLPDTRGHRYSLSEFADSQVVVLVFLGTECPLAKLYAGRLASLARELKSKGVQFLGINSNRQDSIVEMDAYARMHKIPFPILKDAGNKVADQLQAVRTPEVFVLDQDRVVRYWGSVDDQFGVGYQRESASRHYLADAVHQLLDGEDVTQSSMPSVGCHIGRIAEPNPQAKITYADHVSHILAKHCVPCHRPGQIAPFALTDYEEVVGWAPMIVEVIEEGRMPPWFADPTVGEFKNTRSLTNAEIATIKSWVEEGAPEGEPSRLPTLPEYVDGWQLPVEPDVVIPMREEPFVVPAHGPLEYQYFVVDPGFKEDKWVRGAEILYGNPAVVHHLVVMLADSGRTTGKDRGMFLFGRSPGNPPKFYPEGLAKRIPANTPLMFEVHYTPIGSEQKDLSKLGLVLSDPDDVVKEVITNRAIPRDMLRSFVIPAHADDHPVKASWTMRNSAELLSLNPHMHLRGKRIRYSLELPDGHRQDLLYVPNYDFYWQVEYDLKEPIILPAGSQIDCLAHYDNSAQNLKNPDPSVDVKWGDQSDDEMLIAYFDIARPKRSPLGYKREAVARRWNRFKADVRMSPFKTIGVGLAGLMTVAIAVQVYRRRSRRVE